MFGRLKVLLAIAALWSFATQPAAAAPIPPTVSVMAPVISIQSFLPPATFTCVQAMNCPRATDVTSAFAAAKTYIQAMPHGGAVLYLPAGVYPVCNVDWSNASPGQFNFQVGIEGAGQNASNIVNTPGCTGVLINAIGRNNALYRDFTLRCKGCEAGIYMARSSASTNCNGNTLINVGFMGSYTKAAWVHVACEDTIDQNLFYSLTGNGETCAWTGINPAAINVTITSGGTAIASSNTGLFSYGAYCYVSGNNVMPFVFDNGADTLMSGTTIIVAGGAGAHLATYTDCQGGGFGGPVTWEHPHFEDFQGGPVVAHYLNTGDSNCIFNGINNFGGSYMFGDGAGIIDYDRSSNSGGHYGALAILQGATWTSFVTAPGHVADYAYLYGLYSSSISFRPSNADGTLAIFGLMADNGPLGATNFVMPCAVGGTPYQVLGTSAPISGTWGPGSMVVNATPATGSPLGWVATACGTLGTLNGGNTTGTMSAGSQVLTVNNAAGLSPGEIIKIQGDPNPHVVMGISGSTVLLQTPAAANATNAAVSFSAANFAPVASVSATQKP